MKKAIICLIIAFIVIVIIITMYITKNNRQFVEIKEHNQEYEIYLNKKVFGTDVTTVINKATNANVKNEIPKDEKGFFIENETNSIKVELILLNEDKKETYPMEALQKVGLNGFIKNFNLIYFKCSKIEYHEKTQMVRKIIFEQIEE